MRTPPHDFGTGARATTPRAAAAAGIAFAVLFSLAMVLFEFALPDNPQDISNFTPTAVSQITWAVRVVPFAGIAFLWFVGAMRQRLGTSEDQFFATVMLGSGLLFVAMVFVAFSFVSGIIAASDAASAGSSGSPSYLTDQTIAQQIFTIYALKMAAVFMASLSMLWRKTSVMPMPLALITVILAAIMLITTTLNPWMVLIFPAWVLVVSVYLLIAGWQRNPSSPTPSNTSEEGVSP